MALKPVADRVIVKYFETRIRQHPVLFLPDSSKEKNTQAEVIAVGSGKIVRRERSSDTGKTRRPCNLRKIHRN